MKYIERIKEIIRFEGTSRFIELAKYDSHKGKYGAWLLAFGLIDSFMIIKGISYDETGY